MPDPADPDDERSAQHLVVVTFDDAAKAETFLLDATSSAGRAELRLFDAVFITRPEHGRVRVHETGDLSVAKGATESGLWGLVIGTLLLGPAGGLAAGAITAGTVALLAKFVDNGVTDSFIRDVKDHVQPGHTALVLLTDDLGPAALTRELDAYPGTTITSTAFTDAAHDAARAAHASDGPHPDVDTTPDTPSAP